MRRSHRWSELTNRQRAGILGLVVLQAVLAAVAERDLAGRSEQEVRGPRLLWRVASLNTLGAAAYLLVGRRPT